MSHHDDFDVQSTEMLQMLMRHDFEILPEQYVKMLLYEQHADPNVKSNDRFGFNYPQFAIHNIPNLKSKESNENLKQIILWFLKHPAFDVNSSDNNDGSSLIHTIIEYIDDPSFLQFFVQEAGPRANLNLRNAYIQKKSEKLN